MTTTTELKDPDTLQRISRETVLALRAIRDAAVTTGKIEKAVTDAIHRELEGVMQKVISHDTVISALKRSVKQFVSLVKE